MYKDTLFPSL